MQSCNLALINIGLNLLATFLSILKMVYVSLLQIINSLGYNSVSRFSENLCFGNSFATSYPTNTINQHFGRVL